MKKAAQNRGIPYLIISRTNPIPLKTRLDLFKLYVSLTLAYTGPYWVVPPLITSSQRCKIESVQAIDIRTITGMPSSVRVSIFLKFANFNTVKNTIRQQSKKNVQ